MSTIEERLDRIESWIEQAEPPLPSPLTAESIFEIFDGIRIRRPFLGLTRECVRNMCTKTVAELGIKVPEDYPLSLCGDGSAEDSTDVLKGQDAHIDAI